MSRDMDLSKNAGLKSVKNEVLDNNNKNYSNSNESFVNFDHNMTLTDEQNLTQHNITEQEENDDDDEGEEEEERYEILLLPDRSQNSFVQNQNRLSPPLVPQSMQSSLMDNTVLNDCLLGDMCTEDDEIDGDVSPTRIALSNIQEFVETTVVLRKDKKNELGISIVGGNDTYLESICVKEVHKDSAAHRDGRLRKGDLILAVNDISLRDISFCDAVRVLKEAASPLRLLILRENAQKLFTSHQCPTKFITVELRKGSIKDKLGLSIMQRTNGRGVFITYIQPNSIASQHKSIMQGDQILEINGQNVRESNQKDVSQILCELDGAIVLLLGRVPTLCDSIKEWARRKAHIILRARTSTWSSSVGNCNEKLQTQRPSLPVNKDKSYFQVNALSPESDIGIVLPPLCFQTFGSTDAEQQIMSRSSSIRSQKRLSIVAEDSNIRESLDSTTEQEEQQIDSHVVNQSNDTDIHLLPSIKVTEF